MQYLSVNRLIVIHTFRTSYGLHRVWHRHCILLDVLMHCPFVGQYICSTQRRLSGGVLWKQFRTSTLSMVHLNNCSQLAFASVRRLQRYPIGLFAVSASLQ